ncbi:MAG: YceH family protein [Thermodesulfobacteriota bacterium]|nr:YceH family protein [Thermodesulfobacteriota bacterium]
MEKLNDVEIRVLGCLLEKEMATPDLYPLSLNALKNGCNQKTNRFPVVSYDEEILLQALALLREKRLVLQIADRVFKFEQLFSKNYALLSKEAAVFCVLFLRGPQTVGEIRGRSGRLYDFDGLDEVRRTLDKLIELEYVKKLPREPGRKECRYIHLFGDEVEIVNQADNAGEERVLKPAAVGSDRLASLEEDVKGLQEELAALRQDFAAFKKEFE